VAAVTGSKIDIFPITTAFEKSVVHC